MNRKWVKIGFVVLVVLQLAVLGGMILKQEHLLQTGTLIRLKCQPIDPRSLFSGDYVRINTNIHQFEDAEFQRLNRYQAEFNTDDTIYVGLQPQENAEWWVPVLVGKELEPIQNQAEVVIRGQYRNPYQNRVTYGLEEYFVPQFEGLAIERELGDMEVEVVVNEQGNSALKRLLLEGKAVEFY